MKPMLALALLCILSACNVLNDYGNAACGQNPSWCATGGSSTGLSACLLGGATLWECNVVPGSAASLPDPGLVHEHLGACGSFYCATTLADAESQSGAANDNRLVCVPILIGAPAWTSCFPANDTDGGVPCRRLGEICDSAGLAVSDCCPTQQVAPGWGPSVLSCEPIDIDVSDQIGICRVALWEPCASADQCFQSVTPDDKPADCQQICCYGEDRACWSPENDPSPSEQGCCPGFKCVQDGISQGWSCE